jgi:hypothetical protein
LTAYVPSGSSTSFPEVIRSLGSLASGRSNATGTITLAAGVTTTTKIDKNCAAGAAIVLSPTTANGAAALSGCYFSTANGSFTVTHTNNAQTDRTFTYAIIG